MKKRIFFIPLVFVIFVCFDLIVRAFCEYCISRIPEDSNMYGSCVFQLNEHQSDLLILGASKAMHNYDVKMLEDSLHCTVYNMGCDGQNVHYQYMCLLKALDNGPVKTVIFDIAYNQVSKSWEKKAGCDKWFYWSNPVVREYSDRVNDWWYSFCMASACYQYNSNLVDCLKCLRKYDKRGYKGFIRLPDDGGMFRDVVSPIKEELKYSEILIDYLDKICLLCNKNNIKLIFCQSPTLRSDVQFDKFMISYAKSKQASYWNMTNLQGISDNPRYFHDADHLMGVGPSKFTDCVIKKLQSDKLNSLVD